MTLVIAVAVFMAVAVTVTGPRLRMRVGERAPWLDAPAAATIEVPPEIDQFVVRLTHRCVVA